MNLYQTTYMQQKGQMYGYLYQIDRVLYWLSVSPENSIVSIETDDDVVIRLQQGENIETIYEQDKASIKKKYPFSNTNKIYGNQLQIGLH